jgi:class 3 adenylate cyclase
MAPRFQYARSGEASIAYQVIGEGPIDLLILTGWVSQIEVAWEFPAYRRFMERLAEFSRLIIVEPRGSGLSDDIGASTYTLEQDAQDALAVLDAADSERAAIYAKWLAGPVGALLAADHPERIAALVMYASVARGSWAPDYDWALTPEQREELLEGTLGEWGETANRELVRWAPSAADDPALREFFAHLRRSSATPGQARIRWRESGNLDVREVLPRIGVPTLVMHRPDELVWDVRHSRYLAEHIPGARYVELEGNDAFDVLGDSDVIVEEIEEFLTGVRSGGERTRVLLTVMFTDIVGSTSRAAELGDGGWRDLVARHENAVRKELARFGGREVKTMGDGFLVTFASQPSTALRCALAIRTAARDLGIDVRIGVHTGECELIGEDVGGMAVHIASRVSGLAESGEVLVSGAVQGAVVGGPFTFQDRGAQELKGVPGRWPLFALDR